MSGREGRPVRKRAMTGADVGAAASVGAEVGWPGRERRFGFFVRHPLCEALAAESDGEVVGAGFGTRTGATGWLGLICASPRYQGRGTGAALSGRVAELLEGRGCRTLVLTATGAGRRTYEKLGFSVETFYHGFAGPGLGPTSPHPDLRPLAPGDLPAVCDLDLRLIGGDRSHLLRAIFSAGWMVAGCDGSVRGYHVLAPWGGGPVLGANPGAARALVDLVRARAGSRGTADFWVAAENEEGRDYLRRVGFKEERRLPGMVRGEPLS